MSLYLDTSVLVPLLLPDPHSHRIPALLASAPPVIVLSNLARLEFTAVVGRRLRVGILTHAEAFAALAALDRWAATTASPLDIAPADMRQGEALLRRFDLKLRTQDAIHIAIAQRLAATLATFDEPMATAARALGLDVTPA